MRFRDSQIGVKVIVIHLGASSGRHSHWQEVVPVLMLLVVSGEIVVTAWETAGAAVD